MTKKRDEALLDDAMQRFAGATSPDALTAKRQIERRARHIEEAAREEAARIAHSRRKKPVRPKAV